MDCTPWSIQELSLDGRLKEARGQVYLTQRQIWVVKHLQTHPQMRILDVQDKFKVSRFTANKILKPLIENEIIQRRGKGKSTYYILT